VPTKIDEACHVCAGRGASGDRARALEPDRRRAYSAARVRDAELLPRPGQRSTSACPLRSSATRDMGVGELNNCYEDAELTDTIRPGRTSTSSRTPGWREASQLQVARVQGLRHEPQSVGAQPGCHTRPYRLQLRAAVQPSAHRDTSAGQVTRRSRPASESPSSRASSPVEALFAKIFSARS
jgi:hypothetical protein